LPHEHFASVAQTQPAPSVRPQQFFGTAAVMIAVVLDVVD